jgi:2-C-methyl-D-erythritol 4-phosphate cytidylyltransferase
MPKVFAIVPAAGQGTRIGDAVPKQYLSVGGKPLMFHCIEALAAVRAIALRLRGPLAARPPLGEHDWSAFPDKIEPVFAGGAHRARDGAQRARPPGRRVAKDDWVLVHDAARPCITTRAGEQFLDEIGDDPVGGLLAMPVADTLKSADENLRVAATIPRLNLWRAQTPQMFRHDLLRRGLEARPTPPTSRRRWKPIGYSAPRLVQGENSNIKVTFAEDLFLAEMILKRKGTGADVSLRSARASTSTARRRPQAGDGRRRDRRTTRGSSATATPTCCCTRSATRCWARRRWATSASISPTPTRATGASTAASCCATSANCFGPGASRGERRRDYHCAGPRMAPHIPAMVANIAADLGIAPAA